jgi:hypothetical protein
VENWANVESNLGLMEFLDGPWVKTVTEKGTCILYHHVS